MTTLDRRGATHLVLNQAPPLTGHNLYTGDPALTEAIAREGGAWGTDRLLSAGAMAGSAEAQEHAARAEKHEPVLHTHDRYGNRVDTVELDPSWHWLLGQAVEREIPSLPWRSPGRGAHVVRAALLRMWIELDMGVLCPVSMTYAGVPALRRQPELAAEWEPRLTLPDYAAGALIGMAMTEKQGGSDLRASTTRAEPVGDGWEVTGHKWFCSYPSCDVFLTLAQTESGISCFLIERTDPGFRVQRLKDKLGTRSLPSSEVEFDHVHARLVGPEGRGIPTIIEMVNHTRLDCLISSAATMRAGLTQAFHHARHRSAFGRPLVEQPAMRNVLADLALESEAATAVALRVARAYDDSAAGGDSAFRRLATAVAKYWVCKRAPGHAAEALECLGGNGFVEESGLPRIYRDAPLNSIWEGSGNVAALDVLRALRREPDCLPAFLAECDLAAGADRRLDAHLAETRSRLAHLADPAGNDAEFVARRAVADLGLALQASLLVRHAPAAVADAFCASRLGGFAHTYGMLPGGVDVAPILDRALLS